MATVARQASHPISGPPWLTAAYGHLPLPISVTHERKLVWVNPEFERFYSCQLKNVTGKEMKDVVVTVEQLAAQRVEIEKLNASLHKIGLGVRHFLNASHGRDVGVLVLAFSVPHEGREFRVGIALPDRFNDLLGMLARHVVKPEFDEEAFVKKLTPNEKRVMADLSNPEISPKAAGGVSSANGARDYVRQIGKKLRDKGWLAETDSFDIDKMRQLAMALGPLLQAPEDPAACQPPSTQPAGLTRTKNRRRAPRPIGQS